MPSERDEIFNIYKLCVEQSSQISERRSRSNQYFMALNSALFSVIVTLLTSNQHSLTFKAALLVLPAVGFFLCRAWISSLETYRKLNSAKFKVIISLEEHLKFQCFKQEWDIIKNDKAYSNISQTEKRIPVIFLCVYCAVFIFFCTQLICS